MGEAPEFLITASAVVHEEALHGIAAPGGEEDHALVDAVECGLADFCDGLFRPHLLANAFLGEFGEEIGLHRLLLLALCDTGIVGLVFSKKVGRAFGNFSRLGITELTKAVLPWLGTMIVFLVIVTYWPWLTLVLPRALGML